MSKNAYYGRCIHCSERPRRRGSVWCVYCIYQVCCRNYPAVRRGKIVNCVHGGRDGKLR